MELTKAAPVVTIYYAGLGGSIAQLAAYLNGRCVLLPDGSYAASKAAVHLDEDVALPPPYLGQTSDGSDVQPYDVYAMSRWAGWSWWQWALTLPYRQVVWWKTRTETTMNVVAPLPWRCNVGQASDRAHGLAYTRECMAKCPRDTTFVLFGRSRGSAVGLDVFVMLTDEERARIRLVLLEGAFEHSDDVIDSRYGLCKRTCARGMMRWGSEWKDGYERERVIFAEGRLKHAILTTTCPIAIVTSRKDKAVPPDNAVALWRRLMDEGIPTARLHLLQLDQAEHSNYATDNAADAERYSKFLRPLLARM